MRRSWKRGKGVNKNQKFDRDTPVAMKAERDDYSLREAVQRVFSRTLKFYSERNTQSGKKRTGCRGEEMCQAVSKGMMSGGNRSTLSSLCVDA